MAESRLTIPPQVKPWPTTVEEPVPKQPRPTLDLEDGQYASTWPGGRVRVLAAIRGGQVGAYLWLDEAGESGWFDAWPAGAQAFYSDGRLEDFSPWDDTSEPYPAETSLAQWAQRIIDRITAAPEPSPEEARRREQYEAYKRQDRSRELPPHADRTLSGTGEPPADLPEVLQGFTDLPWTSPGQCYERLVNYFKWELGWARDFTNLAPHACARAFVAPERRAETNRYLYPIWDWPGQWGEADLEEIPLYRRILDLAVASREDAWNDPKHWVRCLAGVHADMQVFGDYNRMAWPIVWTLPPPGWCGFWMTMACVSLLFRQEASRGEVLGAYVRRVDAERFYSSVGLMGAFLQASFGAAVFYFNPDAPPWRDGPSLKPLVTELAGLIDALDDVSSPPQPMKSRLLAALGRWVDQRCSFEPGDPAVVDVLGRFVNDRSEALFHRLEAIVRRQAFFDSTEPRHWPSLAMERLGGESGYWQERRNLFRRRGENYARRSPFIAELEDFPLNVFLHRFEVAATTLVGGEPLDSQLWTDQAADLKTWLDGHPMLSPQQMDLLANCVVFAPIKPGAAYNRLIAAAGWVLHPWAPDAWDQPDALLPAFLLMAHAMLSAF